MTDTQKAAQQHKMQMADAVEKVKAEAVIYGNEIKKQAELMDKSKNEILCAEKNMTDAVEELIRDLRQHERNMKAKFREIYQAQQKHHATKQENFEMVVTQMKSCVERGESILERNISAEILQTNQAIIGRCEELLNARKPDIYKPPHVHYMVDKKVDISDRIVVSNTDPTLSLVEGQFQKVIEEKKERNFTIVTKDSDGLQCYHEDDHIKVDILTPTGDQIKTEIKDTKDGKYIVTYTPQCAGQHRVEIQVNGQPLTGSPWVVQVPHQYQFAFKFGSTGKGQGEFNKPWGIAVSEKTGTIAVAEFENERIQMFRSDGIYLRKIALEDEPGFSLAFTESGDILACIPYDDNKLSLFTEGGEFNRYLNDEHLELPLHISFASDGRIITCDMIDNEIKVLSPDGTALLQSFSAPGCDALPWFAVNHQDTFLFSYPDANCVKVFNKAGLYQYDIGCEGSGDGQLQYPTGLVIDKFNHLIVCDTSNERLQVFALDGKFINKIEGPFFVNSGVVGIAMSSNGNLFVADNEKNCIYVFQ